MNAKQISCFYYIETRNLLCIALYGGIVLEEALDPSSDRILNE